MSETGVEPASRFWDNALNVVRIPNFATRTLILSNTSERIRTSIPLNLNQSALPLAHAGSKRRINYQYLLVKEQISQDRQGIRTLLKNPFCRRVPHQEDRRPIKVCGKGLEPPITRRCLVYSQVAYPVCIPTHNLLQSSGWDSNPRVAFAKRICNPPPSTAWLPEHKKSPLLSRAVVRSLGYDSYIMSAIQQPY